MDEHERREIAETAAVQGLGFLQLLPDMAKAIRKAKFPTPLEPDLDWAFTSATLADIGAEPEDIAKLGVAKTLAELGAGKYTGKQAGPVSFQRFYTTMAVYFLRKEPEMGPRFKEAWSDAADEMFAKLAGGS